MRLSVAVLFALGSFVYGVQDQNGGENIKNTILRSCIILIKSEFDSKPQQSTLSVTISWINMMALKGIARPIILLMKRSK